MISVRPSGRLSFLAASRRVSRPDPAVLSVYSETKSPPGPSCKSVEVACSFVLNWFCFMLRFLICSMLMLSVVFSLIGYRRVKK